MKCSPRRHEYPRVSVEYPFRNTKKSNASRGASYFRIAAHRFLCRSGPLPTTLHHAYLLSITYLHDTSSLIPTLLPEGEGLCSSLSTRHTDPLPPGEGRVRERSPGEGTRVREKAPMFPVSRGSVSLDSGNTASIVDPANTVPQRQAFPPSAYPLLTLFSCTPLRFLCVLKGYSDVLCT